MLPRPTHPLGIQRPSETLAKVSVHQQNVVPATDLQVFYDVGDQYLGASVLSYRPIDNEDGYFMMLVSPKSEATERGGDSQESCFCD